MSDTILDRFTIGQGKILPVDHLGPASYATGGETVGTINDLTGIALLGLGSIDMILGSGSLSESGNYFVLAKQTGLGVRKTFKLLWFVVSGGSGTFTGTPATLTGTNSAPTITTSSGGVSTALGVAAGALSEVTGASGITGVQPPVLTMNSYTPAGTVTGIGGLTEVSPGTNLSGETVRLAYVGK